MYVVTADQRRSRTRADAVPSLLAAMAEQGPTRGLVRPFERTAGDEIQALYEDAGSVVQVLVELIRQGQWWVGVGVGPVDEPMPATARAGRGPAYLAAREAVDAAKATSAGVCVRGGEGAEDAEAAAWLMAWLLGRRTPEGWEVVDLMLPGSRQLDVAAKLGVTPQAVSSRLRVAAWQEQQRGERLLTRLLDRADRADGAAGADQQA